MSRNQNIHLCPICHTSIENNFRKTMWQIFDEEELVSNNVALVFYEERFVRNRRQVTVFPNTSVEDLSFQERRNRILCII